MTRADVGRRWLAYGAAVAGLVLGACDATPVTFRILDGVDQDPYQNASTLRVTLRDASEATVHQWTFPVDAAGGQLEDFPSANGLTLEVEVLAADRVAARGRSFAFDLHRGHTPPHPDVYVGRLGRFSTPLAAAPSTLAPLAVVATATGAVWVDEAGDFHRFVLHDRASGTVPPGDPSLRRLASFADRVDASWAALAGSRLLAVGGSAGGAVVVDELGVVVASLPATELAMHRVGASVVAVAGGALVAGGAPSTAGAPSAEVTRLDLVPSGTGFALSATPVGTLAVPRTGATALAVEVRGSAVCPCERAALVGGRDASGHRTRITLLDPRGVDAAVELDDPSVRDDVAVMEISPGVLMLVGGRDGGGMPVADVDTLIARTDGIVPLSPAAPPLFFPRAGASALTLGAGLGIVVGGRTTLDAPSDAAELVEFPGNTLPTGVMTATAPSPRAVVLRNRAVLVVDGGLVTLYASPRVP